MSTPSVPPASRLQEDVWAYGRKDFQVAESPFLRRMVTESSEDACVQNSWSGCTKSGHKWAAG